MSIQENYNETILKSREWASILRELYVSNSWIYSNVSRNGCVTEPNAISDWMR